MDDDTKFVQQIKVAAQAGERISKMIQMINDRYGVK